MEPHPTPTIMRCDRRTMTLTAAGCGRLWSAAQVKYAEKTLQPWEGMATCRTCPIGAKNAGREVEAVFQPAAALARICPRCTRPASRLIKERHCISCYNRDQEALRGRDAKGRRPALIDRLHTETLAVTGDGPERRVRIDHVLGPVEAMLRLARDAKAPVAFGWGRAA